MGRPRLPIDIEDSLALLFRQRGFDGVSLSVIAEQSGMGKASLFHRFPGGKDDMARATIRAVAEQFENALAAALEKANVAQTQQKLHIFLCDFYARGQLGCLIGVFSVPEIAARFRPELQQMLRCITDSICGFLRRLGFTKIQATLKADDFLADLQGSLVLSSINADANQFDKRMKRALVRLFNA